MKNKIYLDIEQPINDEEFSMLVYNIIANAPDFGINLNDIPKPKEARFKTYILDLFFQHYTLVTYLDFGENRGVSITVNDPKAPENLKNKAVIKKTELLRMNDYNVKKAFFDDLAKTLGNKAIIVKEYVNNGSFSGYKDRPFPFGITKSHDNDYYRDLLNKDTLWENKIKPKVDEAIRVCCEKESDKARAKFKAECIPDKKKFADALVMYCEIFRDVEDVTKYIDHCIAINKWIKGEETPSHLLCLFNTDNRFGRNGKTWRMEAERRYMEKNGFLTSSASLCKDGCSSINDFGFHLYYKDEYDFSDSSSDFLKSINKNIRPRISARVMYMGNQTIENEAVIYLCCYNGKPSEKIISSERIASTIRCTDAMYKDNKEKMIEICLKRPETGDNKNKIYYEDLFDGLIKSATDYNHDKVRTGEEEFKLTTYLLDAITSDKTEDKYLSFHHLITVLGRRPYYTPEKASREFRDLSKFLVKNYPDFVLDIDIKKNWKERRLDNTDGKLVKLLEILISSQAIEVTDELTDKQDLKKYIYSLFDLDSNPPVETTAEEENPSQDINEVQTSGFQFE